MNIFKSNNFTKLYYEIINTFDSTSIPETTSRNGTVKDIGRSCIEISNDQFRMPLLLERGFNPIFALCEFSWLISGDNNVGPLENYLRYFTKYSDDGKTLNGAYGFRCRRHFGFDQLSACINLLKTNPDTRRAVIQLWDANDLNKKSKDLPCNTQLMFKIRENKLNITVTNRSNDVFLGVPYNIFVFFMVQLYVSTKLGIDTGSQFHYIDSLHLYECDYQKVERMAAINGRLNFDHLNQRLSQFSWKEFIFDETVQRHLLDKNLLASKHSLLSLPMHYYSSCERRTPFNQTFKDNLLSTACKIWASTFNKIDSSTLDYTSFERSYFMNYNSNYFSSLKRLEIGVLKREAQVFISFFKDHTKDIRSLLNDPDFNSLDDDRLLSLIYVSLIISQFDPSIYESEVRIEFIDKINELSQQVGIRYEDALAISHSSDILLQYFAK